MMPELVWVERSIPVGGWEGGGLGASEWVCKCGSLGVHLYACRDLLQMCTSMIHTLGVHLYVVPVYAYEGSMSGGAGQQHFHIFLDVRGYIHSPPGITKEGSALHFLPPGGG